MLNIVTIHAIRKTSSLPKTLKTLLLSLAVSDVGVGLLVQPFYTSLLVRWSLQMVPICNTFKTFSIIGICFGTSSFLGVVALSVDRFLAIHLHLRYQELVTHKRVVPVVILIWVLSMFLSLAILWTPTRGIQSLFLCIILGIGLVLTAMVYIRIYLAARRHKNQNQVLQVQREAQAYKIANFTSLIKAAVAIFYIYVVFLICYLPYIISLVAIKIADSSVTVKKLHYFSLTVVLMNSSLNPIIYCWKMRHIRHAVINILRNVFQHRSRASHETLAMAGHTLP